MSGPVVLYKLTPAWVLLDSGESMRVWFDSFGVEHGRIQWSLLLDGTPAVFIGTSVPASIIRGIEEDFEDGEPFPLDTPPEYRPLERSAWRLDEAEGEL